MGLSHFTGFNPEPFVGVAVAFEGAIGEATDGEEAERVADAETGGEDEDGGEARDEAFGIGDIDGAGHEIRGEVGESGYWGGCRWLGPR